MRTRRPTACRAPVLVRQWRAAAATLGGGDPLRRRRWGAHAAPRRAAQPALGVWTPAARPHRALRARGGCAREEHKINNTEKKRQPRGHTRSG
eukprot:2781959-Prymnesium_polylepis.1